LFLKRGRKTSKIRNATFEWTQNGKEGTSGVRL